MSRRIRTDYPYLIEKSTSITIAISNHIKLAATLWLPKTQNDEKFATILEYLPYRKADWTSNRDEMRLKYLAGFGYAALRVDIRGTGNSEGLFDDEYSTQEQSDALEILEWIEKQTWSNGKVVIYGKSWGGFNGLQIAFHQPKNLCGVISAYSTDDRYSDDIHYIGGCLTAQEALSWSSQMLIWLAIPPHRDYHGGIDREQNLIDIWKQRLENLVPLDTYWIQHQNRDVYWRLGSICEDYLKILCPVFLIGGYADLYTDPVFRLMNQLQCPKRAIVGPWGHQWPDDAYPGPQIGYLEEIVHWLDHYVKGIDNGYDKKEIFSLYQLNPNVNELHSIIKQRDGQWIHLNSIDSNEKNKMIYYLSSDNCLQIDKPQQHSIARLSFLSPQETGTSSGSLLHWGGDLNPDNPLDQRDDDRRSLVFDSLPLTNKIELIGFPIVKLNLSANSEYGLVCVRLCMIDENTSASILLARGFLNLTHYKSHEHPEKLKPNEIYQISVTLSSLCVSLPVGCRLRLSLSTSCWPIVWPSPTNTTLTIHFDQASPCILLLPILNENYSKRHDFPPPEVGTGIDLKILRDYSVNHVRTEDQINQLITLKINEDNGLIQYPDGLYYDEKYEGEYEIKKDHPESAKVRVLRSIKYFYEDQLDIQTKSTMFNQTNPFTFEIIHELDITNKSQPFFHKKWHLSFPRHS